jgi:hypothetical protein
MLFLTQLLASKTFRWIAIALVILAVVYLIGRAAGKKKEAEKVVKLPNGGSQIPVGWDPKVLANEVYRNFKGIFTWASNKEVTMGKLMSLMDDQLVAVYNTFNRLFSDDGKSLTKWLSDEFNVSVGGVRDSLVSRLVELNCL